MCSDSRHETAPHPPPSSNQAPDARALLGETCALLSLQELVKQVLSALRAIAGNDDVKDAIVRAGGTASIVAAMTRHLASAQVPTPGRGVHRRGHMAGMPDQYL